MILTDYTDYTDCFAEMDFKGLAEIAENAEITHGLFHRRLRSLHRFSAEMDFRGLAEIADSTDSTDIAL